MTMVLPLTPATETEALYVYCVARGNAETLLGPIGLDGKWTFTVPHHGLIAVVHQCKDRPYQSSDPQVVQTWVMAHQDVIQAATEAFGAVLPMAFDRIVHGRDGVNATEALTSWLDEKRQRFDELLDRLAGKAEYGVQVSWDRGVVAAELIREDAELRALQEQAIGQPKGLAYLTQQKLVKAVRSAMEQRADQLAQDFYGRIRRSVSDVRVDPLKKADGASTMLLNVSCLMPEGSDELGSELDEIQKTTGVTVRFTGPWPPYSFVGG